MMRIITGSARGTKLLTLEGENTRPTAERAKEAVFSMLGDFTAGKRVLDLFGGSGQMGLEALSRGADFAVFCDREKEAAEIIRKNSEKTHLSPRVEIRTTDALSYLRTADKPFDLIFLDPPYASGLLPSCLALLRDRNLLSDGAILVLEAGAENAFFGEDASLSESFDILRDARYGAAYIRLLTPKKGGTV